MTENPEHTEYLPYVGTRGTVEQIHSDTAEHEVQHAQHDHDGDDGVEEAAQRRHVQHGHYVSVDDERVGGVYATRADDAFATPRVHCRDCRDESIPHETQTTQVIVYGGLAVTTDAASREASLTLRGPELVAVSDADRAQSD